MSRDEEVYPLPEEFLPERFLGEDRQLDPKEFAFGFGRRICPGMDMADAMLMGIIPAILGTFDIDRSEGSLATPQWTDSLARHPVPFKCKLEVRNPRAMNWVEMALATE